MPESELAALVSADGDFDNFTFIHKHNLSEVGGGPNDFQPPSNRPQTELLNLKASFAQQDPLDEEQSQ